VFLTPYVGRWVGGIGGNFGEGGKGAKGAIVGSVWWKGGDFYRGGGGDFFVSWGHFGILYQLEMGSCLMFYG